MVTEPLIAPFSPHAVITCDPTCRRGEGGRRPDEGPHRRSDAPLNPDPSPRTKCYGVDGLIAGSGGTVIERLQPVGLLLCFLC